MGWFGGKGWEDNAISHAVNYIIFFVEPVSVLQKKTFHVPGSLLSSVESRD